MNVLILGANGAIARLVETGIIGDRAFGDVKLTMFLRDKSRVDDLLSGQSLAVEGDVSSFKDLNDAMEDQDIVLDFTGADRDLMTTKNIVQVMESNGIQRIVSLNTLGIYNEVPGRFGSWNNFTLGSRIKTGKAAADLYKGSELIYTTLRLAWLDDDAQINYELTEKGQSFKGAKVSRRSIASIILKIIDDPDYLANRDVGVGRPKSTGKSLMK